jgi:hypothetical protein
MRRHVLGLINTRESPRKRYGRRLNGLATLASARLSCPWRLGPVSVVSNPSIAETGRQGRSNHRRHLCLSELVRGISRRDPNPNRNSTPLSITRVVIHTVLIAL